MKVRMKSEITGTRNGAAWPPVGKTIELPDAEAARMCQRGYAVPVVEDDIEIRPAKRARVEKRG